MSLGPALEGFVAYPREVVERYRKAGYWEGRSLWAGFADRFRSHADRLALVAAGRRLTYRELGAAAESMAAGLAGLGLAGRDRVVVQLPNVPELVVLYLALQRLGAIPIMALPAHQKAEIGHFVGLAGAAAYVCADPALAEAIQGRVPARTRVILLEELRALGGEPGALGKPDIDPLAPAVLLLSGGTTGLPKLIPRTHNDYWYNSLASGAINGIEADSRLLAVLPLGHNFPLACPGLQGFFQRGARVVLSPTSRAAPNFELIERERVTHLELVPALLIRWLNDPALGRHDLSSVRVVNSGGHRLQPEVKRRCERLLPGCRVQEVFGMAEGLLCYVRLDDSDQVRYETAGRPVSKADEILIVDEEGRPVPPGEVGELLTRGPYTIRGYYRAPEHNAIAFTPEGYYRTGDVVRVHGSGNVVVEGRKKDLINRAGEKISAEEVENLILGHPAVLDVACVPVPDPVMGERMCACIVPRPGRTLSLDELVAFLHAKGIAKFKLPERLELMDEFPTTRVGKVAKQELAARVKAS